MTIRILLVDDQELLRVGFRMILEQQPDVAVIGEAGDGATACRLAEQHRPDVVVMDVRMPVMDGVAATGRIVEGSPSTRVLILTTFDLDEYAFAALNAGASGFLLKDVQPEDLVAAIRTIAAGDAVVSPRITRRLLETFAHQLPGGPRSQHAEPDPALDVLTEREREVLVAMSDGLSNAEIGERLFVSEATVKSHVGRILAKLGLRDRVQAVVLAYRIGLASPS